MDDDEQKEMIAELDRLHDDQMKILRASMRKVKECLGMLGVRAVKMVIQNLKEDCTNVWCDGLKPNLKTHMWTKPTPYLEYETPLTVFCASQIQYEDSFNGTIFIKLKENLFVACDFNG